MEECLINFLPFLKYWSFSAYLKCSNYRCILCPIPLTAIYINYCRGVCSKSHRFYICFHILKLYTYSIFLLNSFIWNCIYVDFNKFMTIKLMSHQIIFLITCYLTYNEIILNYFTRVNHTMLLHWAPHCLPQIILYGIPSIPFD